MILSTYVSKCLCLSICMCALCAGFLIEVGIKFLKYELLYSTQAETKTKKRGVD
jgi:hypothetical protein